MPPETPQIDPAVAQDLASLAMELSQNKETRGAFGRLIKKAKPDSRHALAFADLEIEDKFETFKKSQEDERLKAQQDAIVERLNAQRARLLNGDGERKYSEDDIKAIEALMQKKGISDYDDGATLYAATLPPVTKPTEQPIQHGTTWEFPDLDKFGKDPVRASRDIAGQVIGEFMRKRA